MAERVFKSEAVAFFYANAGMSYHPDRETVEEGTLRCATEMAADEAWGKTVGIEFTWSDDWEIDHMREFDCYDDGPPSTCELCVARLNGETVGALGCIDDASDDYRRVIEAELAGEARHEATKEAERIDLLAANLAVMV